MASTMSRFSGFLNGTGTHAASPSTNHDGGYAKVSSIEPDPKSILSAQDSASKFSNWMNALVWVVVCFGIILRIADYLSGRSLWLDEALLALNIVNRPFPEILHPLDSNQHAPIVFLIVEKLLVIGLGDNEYSLRLFPFLCGTLSMLLFRRTAQYYVSPKALLLAVFLFAVSDPLIYYSGEVKQYSGDVLISVLLLLAFHRLCLRDLNFREFSILGIVGAASLFFSHSAVFILAGTGIAYILFYLPKKEKRKIGGMCLCFLFWGIAFLTVYYTNLTHIADSRGGLLSGWVSEMVPFPPLSYQDFKWYIVFIFKIFDHPGGLTLTGLAACAFVIGCFAIYTRNKKKLFLLILPIFVLFCVSALGKYPMRGRLLLFLAPILLLIVAEGAVSLTEGGRHSRIAGVVFIGFLCLHPLLSAVHHLIKQRTQVGGYAIVEDMKPALTYITERRQEKDLLYAAGKSIAAFTYYKNKYGFKDEYCVLGRTVPSDRQAGTEDLVMFGPNTRIWVLFSHFQSEAEKTYKLLCLYNLDGIGKRLDSFEGTGVSAYLYTLN